MLYVYHPKQTPPCRILKAALFSASPVKNGRGLYLFSSLLLKLSSMWVRMKLLRSERWVHVCSWSPQVVCYGEALCEDRWFSQRRSCIGGIECHLLLGLIEVGLFKLSTSSPERLSGGIRYYLDAKWN